jgi:hypothetical protein
MKEKAPYTYYANGLKSKVLFTDGKPTRFLLGALTDSGMYSIKQEHILEGHMKQIPNINN